MSDRQTIRDQVSMAEAFALLDLPQPNSAGKALCPFHEENTPSFQVYADGHAHCYGCGWNGDVVWFVASVCGTSIWKAERFLAGAVDDLAPSAVQVQPNTEPVEPTDFGRMMREIPKPGRMLYGLAEELVKERWPVLHLPEIEALGVKVNRDGLWIPHLANGRICGIKVKKFNGSVTAIHGSVFRHPYLGWRFMNFDRVVLCEGEPDTWALYTSMVTADVVGLPSGASTYTDEIHRFLQEYRHVFLALDNDKAGNDATEKIRQRLVLDPGQCRLGTDLRTQYTDHKDVADALASGWVPNLEVE